MTDTPTAPQITEADASPPVQRSTPEEVKALIESLRPSNMRTDAAPPQPQIQQDPADPAQPPSKAAPTTPYNFGELRKKAEAAEARASQLEKDLNDLKARVPDEGITKAMQARMDKLQGEYTQAQERLFSLSARESKEWQEHSGLIEAADEDIATTLALPEVTDLGLSFTPRDMDNPQKVNQVIRALIDGDKHVEADNLRSALRAKNVWGGKLKDIEAQSATKRKEWETNRERSTIDRISKTRQELVAKNPHLVPGTPEFNALPTTAQGDIQQSWDEAQKHAADLFKVEPEVQLDRFLATTLAMGLETRKGQRAAGHIAELTKERDSLRQRLAAYEKSGSAPSADLGNGGGSGGPTNLAAYIESLKPQNMRP